MWPDRIGSARSRTAETAETGDGRRETGEGRGETGDGRRETGEGRGETPVSGLRSSVPGLRSSVSGLRSSVSGLRSSVPGLPSPVSGVPSMRLGLRYVKGLREEAGRAIVLERAKQPFIDIDDLHNRVPELRKDEMRKLAAVGALNFIVDQESEVRSQRSEVRSRRSEVNTQSAITNPQSLHRRSALWKVDRATRPVGPLLRDQKEQGTGNRLQVAETESEYLSPVPSNLSPLRPMTVKERVNADFRGTGVTIGRHPMAYRREELNKLGIKRSIDLLKIRNGVWVKIAGWVIVRQRPGTAKGFMFLTMEDETGVANVIITPDIFDRNRSVLTNQPLLLIEGPLQNQDNVIPVRARRIEPLSYAIRAAASHDFH